MLPSLLLVNLGLQAIDGLGTYYSLQMGAGEGNPLIQTAIDFWGSGGALLFWKLLACDLLVLVYCARSTARLALPGLVLTAAAYTVLSAVPLVRVFITDV